MSRRIRLWSVGVLSCAVLACTTTYTDQDVDEIEWEGDSDAAEEAERDEKIGEAGGTNRVRTREELDQIIRDAER